MKFEFLTRLRLEYPDDGTDEKVVVGDFLVRSARPEIQAAYRGGIVLTEDGYRTDLGSVPRLPLAFLLFGAVGDKPAVVHDKLYSDGKVPRKIADEVFADALAADGVAAWRRGPMWLGVRLFGGFGGHYTAAS